jgi:hypothetical protein
MSGMSGATEGQEQLPRTLMEWRIVHADLIRLSIFATMARCPAPDASNFNIQTFNPRKLEPHVVHSGTAWQFREYEA